MKRPQLSLLVLLCALLLCLPSLACATPQSVTVRGTAPGSNAAAALEDARHDAVYKVLAHTIRLDNTPPEIVAEIMEGYGLYVLGTEQLQQGATESGSFVIARITVDRDLLQRRLEALVAHKQAGQPLLKACFLLRTVGADSPEDADSLLLLTCSSAYQNLGFETKTNDSFLAARQTALRNRPQEDLASFEKAMLQKLQNDWLEYQFAIIGQVEVTTRLSDATGVTKTARVRARALDVLKQQFIWEIDEDYTSRGATAAEAEQLAIQKAALDCAEQLGGKTLQYWKKQ